MELWKAENLGELFATYLAPRIVSRETKTADPSVDARTKYLCNVGLSINSILLCTM